MRQHIIVASGLCLSIQVIFTNLVGIRQCGERGVKRAQNGRKQMAAKACHVYIWTDGGFDGETFRLWVMDVCSLVCAGGATRLEQTIMFLSLLKKRWVAELNFWLAYGVSALGQADVELLPETSETLIWQ